MILFFGAEFTRAYANVHSGYTPSSNSSKKNWRLSTRFKFR